MSHSAMNRLKLLEQLRFCEDEGAPPPDDAFVPMPAGKPHVRAGVIRAAAADGRDLPTFVTAMIDLGLECWLEGQAHG